MKTTISKNALLFALGLTVPLADPSSTMPILANVKLVAEDGNLSITATDLNISATVEVESTVQDPGSITVHAGRFLAAAKTLPAGDVLIEDDQRTLHFGGFDILSLPARDFPRVTAAPATGWFAVPATTLSHLIAQTEAAVSNDETRHHLNGALLEIDPDGATRMVATDGHRLSLSRATIERRGAFLAALVPKPGLKAIKRLAATVTGDVDAVVDAGWLHVKAGAVRLTVKLSDAQFPPYQQVIPRADGRSVVKVGRDQFIEALRRVMVVANNKTYGAAVKFSEGRIEVAVENPDLGRAKEAVTAECAVKKLTIGVNVSYLLDALTVTGDEVVGLTVGDTLDPITIEHATGLAVVMPMRL